jgi:hypothetical protein
MAIREVPTFANASASIIQANSLDYCGMNIGANVTTINPPHTIASKAAHEFSFWNFTTGVENNVTDQRREFF